MIASETTARPGRSAGRRGLIVTEPLPERWHLHSSPAAVASSGHMGPRRTAAVLRHRLEAPHDADLRLRHRRLDVGNDGPGRSSAAAGSAPCVTATGTRAHPIFVGIARKSQIASYLGRPTTPSPTSRSTRSR